MVVHDSSRDPPPPPQSGGGEEEGRDGEGGGYGGTDGHIRAHVSAPVLATNLLLA